MKRKSGLHKKVSSIFGDIPLPENPSSPMEGNENSAPESTAPQSGPRIPGIQDPSAKQPYQDTSTVLQQSPKVVSKPAGPLSEEEEYAAEQRKKLFMVIGLVVVLAVVLFVNFYKPAKKTPAAKPDKLSEPVMIAKSSAIYWPTLKPWPENMRDPMIYDKSKARLTVVESKIEGPLILRGIVHKPDGKSMALIGTEILYVGDKIEGWTLKQVQKEVVKLENDNGEKLELKMKDR